MKINSDPWILLCEGGTSPKCKTFTNTSQRRHCQSMTFIYFAFLLHTDYASDWECAQRSISVREKQIWHKNTRKVSQWGLWKVFIETVSSPRNGLANQSSQSIWRQILSKRAIHYTDLHRVNKMFFQDIFRKIRYGGNCEDISNTVSTYCVSLMRLFQYSKDTRMWGSAQ